MQIRIALDHFTKETIDAYANIHCLTFGDILLQAMGIDYGCTIFKLSNHSNRYIIGWYTDNGNEYVESFEYETIKKALKGKGAHITLDVHTRR